MFPPPALDKAAVVGGYPRFSLFEVETVRWFSCRVAEVRVPGGGGGRAETCVFKTVNWEHEVGFLGREVEAYHFLSTTAGAEGLAPRFGG